VRHSLVYRIAVYHKHGIAAPDEPIRLDKQFGLHRRCIPDPGRNEVVQLIVFAKRKPLRHRLNALSTAGTDPPRHVEWTHLSPPLVTQPSQKRLEKASKLLLPIRRPANHGRPLQKPTTHESSKNWFGNPAPLKICQSSARPHIRQLERALLQRTAGPYIWLTQPGSDNGTEPT